MERQKVNLPGSKVEARSVLLQVARFGVVGVAATAVHSVVVISLVELRVLPPTPANVLAFCCALFVSYFGHYYWTFQSASQHRSTFLRFSVAAATGFALNYGIFFLIVDSWHAHYLIALCVVFVVVPAVTFFMNKLWAFR